MYNLTMKNKIDLFHTFICMTVSGLLFFLLLISVFVFVLLDPFCLGKLETVLLCRNELKNADNCPKCKDSCKRNS